MIHRTGRGFEIFTSWLVAAGVEAQTLTVWRQADRYNLPRIIYVNKMDRADSDIHMCCSSIEKKFDLAALLLQLPARAEGKLTGKFTYL